MSKQEFLPANLTSRLDTINGDVLDNLEESIAIQKLLETRLLERIDTGESKLAWDALKGEISSYKHQFKDTADEDIIEEKEAQLIQAVQTIDRLDTIITNGARSFAVQTENRADIQRIHESQRKLTETLTKCRKEVQETYTQEQWNLFLSGVLTALRARVDADILVQVLNDMDARGVPMIEAVKVKEVI